MKTRKLISVLLIIACVIPLACCATKVEAFHSYLIFDSASSLSEIGSVKDAEIIYVESEKAIRVKATGTRPEFSFTPATDDIRCGVAVITYRTDSTNSADAFEGTIKAAAIEKTFCYK